MAKITTKKKTIKLSSGSVSTGGSVACNMCKGTGRLPAGYNKKKKK